MSTNTTILTQQSIAQKIKRMAYQIAENNTDQTKLILAGILPNGYLIANALLPLLTTQHNKQVTVVSVSLNKSNPQLITYTPNITTHGETIIVIDDVSMTGRTMLYALQPLLALQPNRIQTLVLVERQQKNYPVHSDYVGLHINTTLQNHIIVAQKNGVLHYAYME